MTYMSRQAALAIGIIAPYVRSKLAMDASIDLRPLLIGSSASNWLDDKPKILRGIQRACKGKLGRDASIGEVAELLDMIDSHGVEGDEPVVPSVHNAMIRTAKVKGKDGNRASESKFNGKVNEDDDPLTKAEEFLKEKLSDNDLARVLSIMRGEAEDEDFEDDEDREDDSDDREEENNPDRDPNEDDEIDRTRETSPNEYQRRIGKARDNPPNMRRAGRDEPPPFKGRPRPGGAMDAAMIGDLNRIGVIPMERQQLHLDNFGRTPDGRMPARRPKAQIAMDAKARSRSQSSFARRFPDAAKIGRAM
jgi:hypothetical protein